MKIEITLTEAELRAAVAEYVASNFEDVSDSGAVTFAGLISQTSGPVDKLEARVTIVRVNS